MAATLETLERIMLRDALKRISPETLSKNLNSITEMSARSGGF